jgi:hypothetical protein
MIKKQFHNPAAYYLIKTCSTLVVTLIFSVFFYFGILVIFSFTNVFGLNGESYKEALMVLPVLILSYHVIAYLTLGSRNNKAFSKTMDRVIFSPRNQIELILNEKILMEESPCIIEGTSITSSSRFPRHIIVTNFRIIIGFLNSIPLLFKGKMEEKMGFMNLWQPGIGKIPDIRTNNGFLDAMGKILGANTRIVDMAYGVNRGGKFVIVRPRFWIPMYFTFYHPKADLIYDSFRGVL